MLFTPDEHFGTIPQGDQHLADYMGQKIDEWRTWAGSKGLMSLWTKKLKNYYGISAEGNTSQAVTAGGSQGELALIKINDLRPLLQEQLVTITSQRPAGRAMAVNSDPEAIKSARIGSAVAEYYMVQNGLEAKFVQAAERAILCDEAWVDLFWDKLAGEVIAVDEANMPIRAGDLLMRVHSPWFVARDPGANEESVMKWLIITMKGNKFDLAAMYPGQAQAILNCKDDNSPNVPMDYIPDGSDQIFQHLLICDRSPSVQNGRYALMIADKIVLDTDLPYKCFPVTRIAPSLVIDGPTGYSGSNDILGMEQITDALHSIITTNETNFGGNIIVGPEGMNINVVDLAKGTRYFELPPDMIDKLKSLSLAKTPGEIFNYINVLQQKKDRAVGSVSGILTQQASQGASGSSMALIQNQAISFNSGIQRSYFKLLSQTMTNAIMILQSYADEPKIAKIVGRNKAQGLKEFKYTGKDLSGVSTILYEEMNPAFQTYGGRLQMAQDLIKMGQIKSPKQYINVVQSGNPDVLTQDDEADGMLILEENEALQEGRPVKAVISEQHVDHIKSHLSLNTQDAKEKDPQLVSAVLAHVQEHIDLWMQASANNPGILIATGQQPLMPPAPPPGLQMAPGGQNVPHGTSPASIGGPPPVVKKADHVSQPSLPNIPGTHDKPQIPGVTDQAI